jgi:excisionase family DNA binding protein
VTGDLVQQLRVIREALTAALEALDIASKVVAETLEQPPHVSQERPLTVSPRRFAELTALPRDRIYRMLDTGQLRGIRLGTRWYVPISEAERLLDDLQGRPAGV